MGTIRQIDSAIDDRKCGCVVLYRDEFEVEGLESGIGELSNRRQINGRDNAILNSPRYPGFHQWVAYDVAPVVVEATRMPETWTAG